MYFIETSKTQWNSGFFRSVLFFISFLDFRPPPMEERFREGPFDPRDRPPPVDPRAGPPVSMERNPRMREEMRVPPPPREDQRGPPRGKYVISIIICYLAIIIHVFYKNSVFWFSILMVAPFIISIEIR